MIHYTLLPEEEALGLKREYRVRVFIVFAFFISFAIVAGIVFLFPSYLMSSIQERDLAGKLAMAEKSKEARGVDVAIRKLKESNLILKKIKEENQSVYFSSVIQQIVATRPPTATFNSITISSIVDKQADHEVIIQGKSLTRESLLELKKNFEKDLSFSKVEFPIPDLTRNKDIPFAVKLRLKKQNES